MQIKFVLNGFENDTMGSMIESYVRLPYYKEREGCSRIVVPVKCTRASVIQSIDGSRQSLGKSMML